MKCNIHTAKDLAQKLGETVCRYKGIPYWIAVDEDRRGLPTIHLRNLVTGGNEGTIKYDNPEFDISSIPLGYCQSDAHCRVVYCIRLPLRRVRQGVCSSHLRVQAIQGNPWAQGATLLRSQGFYNLVVGNYISLDVGMDTLRKKLQEDKEFIGEIAISRKIALSINSLGIINVYYKQELVGWIEPSKFVVHIPTSDKATIISKYLSHVLGWEID